MQFLIYWGSSNGPLFEAMGQTSHNNPDDKLTLKFDSKFEALDFLRDYYNDLTHGRVLDIHQARLIYNEYNGRQLREAITITPRATGKGPDWWQNHIANKNKCA